MSNPSYMRVQHFTPALEFYRKLGAPVDRALQHAGLPLEIELYPEAYMRHEREVEFLRFLRDREPIDDIGWRIYGDYGLHVPDRNSGAELSRKMLLGQRLIKFKGSLWRANSFIKTRITPIAEGVRFEFLDQNELGSVEKLSSDWTRIMAVVALLQAGLGPGWRPPKIGHGSMAQPCDESLIYFERTKILQGQATTWVDIPNSALAYHATSISLTRQQECVTRAGAPAERSIDTPDYGSASEMLKLMLLPYISEGFPCVDAAAEMVKCSRRTFQRRLREEGCSYAELTRDLRIEHAQRLLATGDMKIIDVAVAVGFDHAPNFSRAFTSRTGMSPSAYSSSIGLQ